MRVGFVYVSLSPVLNCTCMIVLVRFNKLIYVVYSCRQLAG